MIERFDSVGGRSPLRLSGDTAVAGAASFGAQEVDRSRETSHQRTGLAQTVVGALVVVIAALAVSTARIADETALSLQGDMPRYLMNGVFLRDLAEDAPVGDLLGYARRYYARYPALSLGHHPVLLPAVEAAAFAVSGISVRTARGVIVLFWCGGALAMFVLVRRVYGTLLGTLASLLLVTSPFAVQSSRVVMSEVPALALVIVTVLLLHRYCDRGGRGVLALFVIAATLSLYGKQVAVFMLPVYAAYFLATQGFRKLFTRDVMLAGLAIAVAAVPLVFLTIKLSPFNVALVTTGVIEVPSHFAHLRTTLKGQFTLPLIAWSGAGLLAALYTRDRRALLFVLWIGVFYLSVHYVTRAVDPVRYAIYWMPAFCVLAASVAAHTSRRGIRAALVAGLAATVTYQSVAAYRAPLQTAGGYEEAARYVVEHPLGSSVLFSGPVDSGYFVFFVRKHDPLRQFVVLRADKLLTTSRLQYPAFRERIRSRDEIYRNLRDFGTGYVVIEDLPIESEALEWLREEVRSPRFIERARIPIRSTDARLRGGSLAVYEYVDRTPARADAPLEMDLPLVNQSLGMHFGELMTPGTARPR